ncbi:MAG: HD domain-containing protein [Patescibacteria group bacterium]|nr:HD domain-containing protein [Patescibacteria group bacterium]
MRQKKINDILLFLKRSRALESAKRYGSSMRAHNNTVAEHSWRLGLMALIIGTESRVRIDMNRTLALALLHDLAEAKTGDIDAYEQILAGKKLIEEKAVMEEKAMHQMTDDLPFGDWIYALWHEYEDQITIESKFVKALDKIEGFLHIAEVGVEAYIPKEFHADYATKAVVAFDEAMHHFPELKDFLEEVKKDLKTQFEKVGVKWIDSK